MIRLLSEKALSFVRRIHHFSNEEKILAAKIADLLSQLGDARLGLRFMKRCSKGGFAYEARNALLGGAIRAAGRAGEATVAARGSKNKWVGGKKRGVVSGKGTEWQGRRVIELKRRGVVGYRPILWRFWLFHASAFSIRDFR